MVEIPKKGAADDWHHVPETTPEQDMQTVANPLMPEWMKAPARERLAMDPETRKAEFEARKAEAESKNLAELRALSDVGLERTKTEERIADKQLEREKVKKGVTPGAQQRQADPNSIKLKVVRFGDMTDKEQKPYFLVEPYLIAKGVVGFYGRGGSGKSSFLATLAANISTSASTLWVSTEEDESNILNRYLKPIVLTDDDGVVTYVSGGQDAALQIYQTVVLKVDKDGRALESDFNVYEHLEPAIIMANSHVTNLGHGKPVKLVVLDTIVALTTWDKNANSYSDEGVKRLLAYLRGVADRHDVTIAVVGHSNKGKHEHFADSVMGATAWVNSPRLSFLHAKDRVTDGQFIVRLAKGNEVPEFAQTFRLHMVHELAQIADGPKAGMSKATPLARVWGGIEAAALWDEVTTVAKDGEEGGFVDRRKPTLVDEVTTAVVELTGLVAVPVSREMVHAKLGRTIHNREWTRVDERLLLGEMVYEVEVGKVQSTVVYRRKIVTTDTPEAPPS